MSKKRYTFECIDNNCLIYEDGVWLKIEEVIDLLNEFETKCYKLEKENEKLKKVIDLMEYQLKVQDRIIKEYEDGESNEL